MKKYCLLILAASLCLHAKSQYYNYALNSLQIPSLSRKGDLSFGIGWANGSVRAFEIQGVYSPAKHWAIMANYFDAGEKEVRKHEETGTNYHFGEVAAGLYERLPRGTASLFAGVGSGSLFSHYGLDRTASFNLLRWFVQPGIRYQNQRFQTGLALRLTRLSFASGEVSYSIESPYINHIQNIEKRSPLFLPELGLQVGLIIKPVVINLGIASIFPDTRDWNFARVNVCLSVVTSFNILKKKDLNVKQ